MGASGDLELETVTLQLINMIAYASSSRAHSKRLRAVVGVDLPPSDIRVLEFLAGHDPLPLSTLASELGTDLGQASRQASSLEALGHVVRRTDPLDRRRTLVSLSEPTAQLLDKWLLDWGHAYGGPLDAWSEREMRDLTKWFRLVLRCLEEALPSTLRSPLPERWSTLVADERIDTDRQSFLVAVIALIAWVSQSGGFNDLLESLDAPIRQHGWFTLRVVARHGPLSVAEVAERMAIDPSQASKRLTQLTDLGLVDRTVDVKDRRSSLVRLSAAGAALEQRVRQWQLEAFASILDPFSDARRARWTRLMSRYMRELVEGAIASDRWAGSVAEAG